MPTFKSLIPILLLASSSIAVAAPRYDNGRYDRYDRYGDRRSDGDRRPRRYRPAWVSLGQLDLDTGRREALDVYQRGTFTQLRFQATGGRVDLERVIVRFRGGGRQVANLSRSLGRGVNYVDLPLDGNNRRIDRIVVLGDSTRAGELQVFGI